MSVRNEAVNMARLSFQNHDRDAAEMRYVYPVVSRRAAGVSIGINLNVNNACNWACVYCQVPDLTRGSPPPVDLDLLARELAAMLDDVLSGDFLVRRVPESMRRLADIAFSGNGEPTSSSEFPQAVEVVIAALQARGMLGHLPIRIITNGSLMHRPTVLAALGRLGMFAGEIWFKVDRASEEGMQTVNQTAVKLAQVTAHLKAAAGVAPVWLQTCWFGLDNAPPSGDEADRYIAFVATHREWIAGVHLYGIARPSMQPGRERLLRLPRDELDQLAGRLKKIGVTATVSE